MNRLKADNFELAVDTEIYDRDLSYEENTALDLELTSYGFSVKTTLDADIRRVAAFARDIMTMYVTLKGSATIDEPYGDRFIDFRMTPLGHVQVKGELSDYSRGYSHEMKFENEFDQTYLKSFAEGLMEEYGKYL